MMTVPSNRHSLLRHAKRRAGIVLISLGIGIAASYAATVLTPPTYQATGSVVVTGGAARDPVTGQIIDTSLARNLVPTIARLAESREVALAAAEEAKVPPEMVVDHVSTDFQQNVQVILITAKAPTAEQSAAIANAVTHAVGARVQQMRLDGTGSVGAQPLDQAAAPKDPSLPKPLLDTALGALLSLLAGVGAARIRDELDDKISDIDELRAASDTPVLASIPFDRQVTKKPLITDRPRAPWTEAFAQLRTNLEFLANSRPAIVAVTSAIAGEGKSIVACNVALALARAGRRVLLVEADLRRPACTRYLGITNTVGLAAVLAGNAQASDAIQPGPEHGLMVLPAGLPAANPSELLASRNCDELLREQREHYDVVLLDLPSLLPIADAAVLAGKADATILLARYRHTRGKQIRRALDSLSRVNARPGGCVLNMVPPRREGYGYDYRYPFDATGQLPASRPEIKDAAS